MNTKLKIITNNKPRRLIEWRDLTASEQSDFGYVPESERDSRPFVRYMGNTYDLDDMMATPTKEQASPDMREAGFHNWCGYADDSFFSGIVFKYTEDNEYVIIGRYFC